MGYMKTIRQILEAGVDTSLTDIFGQTALLAAAKTGHEEVIKLLLTVGFPTREPEDAFAAAIMALKPFDRNSVNSIGQTPLGTFNSFSRRPRSRGETASGRAWC